MIAVAATLASLRIFGIRFKARIGQWFFKRRWLGSPLQQSSSAFRKCVGFMTKTLIDFNY